MASNPAQNSNNYPRRARHRRSVKAPAQKSERAREKVLINKEMQSARLMTNDNSRIMKASKSRRVRVIWYNISEAAEILHVCAGGITFCFVRRQREKVNVSSSDNQKKICSVR